MWVDLLFNFVLVYAYINTLSMANYIEQLETLPGMKTNQPLKSYTTFGVGGPAKFFLETNDIPLIQQAIQLASEAEVAWSPLGGGSNVIISDNGFPGLIIKLSSIKCEVLDNTIIADAGTSLARVVRAAIGKNLTGLEFAIGIPGTFGGALAGNAGISGRGVAALAKEIQYISADGELHTMAQENLDVSYRYTRFKYSKNEIIVSGTLYLNPSEPKQIQQLIKETLNKRSWQPKGVWCAGCIFKNPSNNFAGKLIQEAGLKGKKIGGAKVSEDHGNFILNTGTATAEDIIILVSLIKQQIRDKFGVQLEEEVRYLGFENI
jgi:UDP-N-acetylmuramate dehydrogenase